MNDERALLTQREMADRLAALHRPALFTHRKPDGDALGALAGLRAMLAQRGAAPIAFVHEPVPPRYTAIAEFAEFPVWTELVCAASGCDGIIVLDTCTHSQLEPIAPWLRAACVPRLVIDHHRSREEIADGYLVDESASATCLMLYELARAVGWSVDAIAARSLFVGLATDTGWFRHANTDARTHQAAAELIALGVDSAALFDRLYLRDSAARVRLVGAALGSLELFHDEQLALMTLDRGTFARCGAGPGDTEDVINEALRIGSVVSAVLLVEQEDGVVRANFRSKPPDEHRAADVDVSKVAESLGGGGHHRAAGARLNGPLAHAKSIVLERLLSALDLSASTRPDVPRP